MLKYSRIQMSHGYLKGCYFYTESKRTHEGQISAAGTKQHEGGEATGIRMAGGSEGD